MPGTVYVDRETRFLKSCLKWVNLEPSGTLLKPQKSLNSLENLREVIRLYRCSNYTEENKGNRSCKVGFYEQPPFCKYI